ncbi:unnamed protein product [Urochloa humidicola]
MSGSGSSTRWGWGTATAVEIELQVLDCTICYCPLKPPVFQCPVGHVVCSSCLAKLRVASRRNSCHMCGSAGGFSRCFAVEHILDSIQVPCANAGAIRGCTAAKMAYHDKEEHEETCPHAGGGTEIEADQAADPGVLPESEAQEKDGENKGDRKGGSLTGGFGGLVRGLCISAVIVPVLHDIMRKRK